MMAPTATPMAVKNRVTALSVLIILRSGDDKMPHSGYNKITHSGDDLIPKPRPQPTPQLIAVVHTHQPAR